MFDIDPIVRERAGILVAPIEAVRPLGIDAFVTTRHGGVSLGPYHALNLATHVGDRGEAVDENRRRVAQAIGVTPQQLHFVHQVHGSAVATLTTASTPTTADALVTTAPDVAIAILVADCVPLLLADTATSTMAVVHAGWRGLVNGVIAATLRHFTDPDAVRAYIGPHIEPERYQVGDDVAAAFAEIPGALVDDGTHDGAPKWRLDLGVVAHHQLRQGGVLDEHCYRDPRSTGARDLFFSDRGERPCGRFALVARRAPYDTEVRVAQ